MASKINHWDWKFAGILLVALALRVMGLSTRGIWYDDAFTILLAGRSFPEIISGTAADTMPPLFYLLLHFWEMVGRDIAWLRLLSVLFSLGGIVFLYSIIKHLFGQKEALWGAAAAAVSPLQIFNAQEIRMYAALVFFQAGYLYSIVRAVNLTGKNTHYWVIAVAMGTAAMYSHNLALFGLVFPGFYLLVRREWQMLARWSSVMGAIGLLSLPWLWRVPGQIEKIQTAFWTPTPGPVEVINAFLQMHIALPMPSAWIAVGFGLSVLVAVLIVFELWKRGRGSGISFLLAGVLIPPLLMFIASYFMRPIFVPRGFIISALLYCGLVGVIAAQTANRVGRYLLAGSFAAAALISLPFYYGYDTFPRSPYQQAANYLREQVGDKDLILHDNKLSYFPSRIYAENLNAVFIGDVPGSHNDTLAPATEAALGIYPVDDLSSAIEGYDRIYFVVFDQAIAEYDAMGKVEHPVKEFLSERMSLIGSESFADLQVLEYQR